MKLYSDAGLSSRYFETSYLSNLGAVIYFQNVSLSQMQFMQHDFLFRKFNFLIEADRIQL